MKKPPRSDASLLDDMIRFCEMIIRYTSAKTLEDFVKEDMCHMAVLHTFALLGEASTKISKEIKEKNPQIAWREMSDFRNVIIHWYHGVDLSIPWNTAKDAIPSLQENLKNIHS